MGLTLVRGSRSSSSSREANPVLHEGSSSREANSVLHDASFWIRAIHGIGPRQYKRSAIEDWLKIISFVTEGPTRDGKENK